MTAGMLFAPPHRLIEGKAQPVLDAEVSSAIGIKAMHAWEAIKKEYGTPKFLRAYRFAGGVLTDETPPLRTSLRTRPLQLRRRRTQDLHVNPSSATCASWLF